MATLMEALMLQHPCSPYDHFSSSMFLTLPLWHQWQRVSLLGASPPFFMHLFSLSLSLSLSLHAFVLYFDMFISSCSSPSYSSLLITKSDSRWKYNFSDCMRLNFTPLIFLFLSLWHHGKKDNSLYRYVSPCLHASSLYFFISFSDDFSSLDLYARCRVDQCRDTCTCFLCSRPLLFVFH
jgi:hypothetical protein